MLEYSSIESVRLYDLHTKIQCVCMRVCVCVGWH